MFTIDWTGPFGLAMIEALACGTPVIARPCGSVPEVLHNGVSGIIATGSDDSCGRSRILTTFRARAAAGSSRPVSPPT
jgi:glycosyltransferase involved in cell wall biosynthesis